MNQYAGIDVLELEPDGKDSREDPSERRFTALDPGTGKRDVYDPESASRNVRSFLWICDSLADVQALKDFMDARRGRAAPFWLPSLTRDITLNGDFLSAHQFIDVVKFGYAANMFPDTPARRYLFFRSNSGAYFYRKAVNAVDNQNGTESIYLDATLGQDVPRASWTVGFLRLCRLEDDMIEIEHHVAGGQFAQAVIRIREIPHEVPA